VARVIYLNGTSSAGKSSIARALREQFDELYLHVQLDVFMQMVPLHGWERAGGMVMTPQSDHGIRVDFGPVCQPLFSGFHQSLAALASAGNHLIVDDVLLERGWLRDAVEALVNHEVCFVGVHCHVDVAEARERKRSDRDRGIARGQYNLVHAHGLYDVEVDTSLLTPHACAERILKAQQGLHSPTAFERLRDRMDSLETNGM
jgi:chloramphenicol 3-O phosphotransferase